MTNPEPAVERELREARARIAALERERLATALSPAQPPVTTARTSAWHGIAGDWRKTSASSAPCKAYFRFEIVDNRVRWRRGDAYDSLTAEGDYPIEVVSDSRIKAGVYWLAVAGDRLDFGNTGEDAAFCSFARRRALGPQDSWRQIAGDWSRISPTGAPCKPYFRFEIVGDRIRWQRGDSFDSLTAEGNYLIEVGSDSRIEAGPYWLSVSGNRLEFGNAGDSAPFCSFQRR